MSSSTRIPHKFLLDENVRKELARFLTEHTFDAKVVPKSATDVKVAAISKNEARILVTNDEDFIYYTKDTIFSVVWLRISQSNHAALLSSFKRLVSKMIQFSGKLIILNERDWDERSLGEEIKFRKGKVTVSWES